MTEADLLLALRDCYDPQTRRNLVELGMIRSASLLLDRNAPGAGIPGVPPRFRALITVQARGSDESANAQIVAQVANRLAGLPAISGVEVRLLPPLLPILHSTPGAR